MMLPVVICPHGHWEPPDAKYSRWVQIRSIGLALQGTLVKIPVADIRTLVTVHNHALKQFRHQVQPQLIDEDPPIALETEVTESLFVPIEEEIGLPSPPDEEHAAVEDSVPEDERFKGLCQSLRCRA